MERPQRIERREENVTSFAVKPIGRVASPLTDLELAPRQADEGAPEARSPSPGVRPGSASGWRWAPRAPTWAG